MDTRQFKAYFKDRGIIFKEENGLFILDPAIQQLDNWSNWQGFLRMVARFNQNERCLACQSNLYSDSQLHHALITRKDNQGNKDRQRIHHTYNVMMLHPSCHEMMTRERAATLLTALYGLNVKKWYDNFETAWRKPNIF